MLLPVPTEYESLKKKLKSANPEGSIVGYSEPEELTWENGEIRVRGGIPKKTYGG